MKEALSPFKRYWQSRQRKRLAEQEAYERMNGAQKLWSWVKTIVNAIVVVTIINGLALASMFVPTPSMETTVLAGENLFVNKFIFGPSTPQIIPIVNIPLPFYKLPPLRDPKVGDIIVFIFPGFRDQVVADEFQYYLKRCVGVSGDTVQVINDSVYVNGRLFPLPAHAQHYDPYGRSADLRARADSLETFPIGKNYTRSNYGPIRIPKEGDKITLNRKNIFEWATFIQREGHKVSINGEDIRVDGVPTPVYTVERDYVFGMGDNRWNSLDSRFWGFIPKNSVVGTPMIVYWSMENTEPIPASSSRFGEQEKEMPLLKRFAHIRWSRLGTIINK